VLTRPVAGLSLLHVEAPVFAGPQLAVKTAIDRIAAAALLIGLSPLFAVVTVLIRRDHGGSVIFRQERIGKDGLLNCGDRSREPSVDAITAAAASVRRRVRRLASSLVRRNGRRRWRRAR